MRLRWECTTSSCQLLPFFLLLPLFLRLLVLFQPLTNVISTEGGGTLPPQWRDPCISSLLLLLPLPLLLLLFLPLLVVRRHSERSEEPPYFAFAPVAACYSLLPIPCPYACQTHLHRQR